MRAFDFFQNLVPSIHPRDVYILLEQFDEYDTWCRAQGWKRPDDPLDEISTLMEIRDSALATPVYGERSGTSGCCPRPYFDRKDYEDWLRSKYGQEVLTTLIGAAPKAKVKK